MAKQSKEDNYYCKTSEQRIDYILNHFGQMEQMLNARKESLIYVMSNQRAYNRKKNSEDICIHVQTSVVFKSRTEEEAIERYMLGECIENGKITQDLEVGIDTVNEINRAIFDIHLLSLQIKSQG